MIACMSFSPGFFIVLLAPLAFSYLISCYEALMIICNKPMSYVGVISRGIPVFTISGIYFSIIGIVDSFLLVLITIPVLISSLSFCLMLAREKSLNS